MKKIDLLLELSRLLCDEGSLESEIRLAENQPLNYLGQFSDSMQERGIESAIPELPWIAMVDGLARRNLLIELDWKDDPEELIETSMKLLEDHHRFSAISENLLKLEPYVDEDIEEFLPQLNRKLLPYKVQLARLDIDSDSYPLAIISLEDVVRAKELALASGYGKIIT